MKGDCISIIPFILYLARCLIKPIKTNVKDFLITPKYADGIKYVGTLKLQISGMEKKVYVLIKKFQLTVNTNKIERFIIPPSHLLSLHHHPPPP